MEDFAGMALAAKFCLLGGALFGARVFQKMPGKKKTLGSIPATARPSILVDLDDDEHEGDYKENEDDADQGEGKDAEDENKDDELEHKKR